MGLFDDLVTQVVDEADREVFKKYSKFAEKVNEADSLVSRWESWKEAHWDDSAKTTKEALQALQQKDQEIEALRLLQAGDMTWDEIKNNVEQTALQVAKSKGFVDTTEMQKALDSRLMVKQGEKMVPVTDYAQNLERGVEFMYAKSAHLPLKYFSEFGEVKTMEEFMTYMRENGIQKFDDAYERMAAPLRSEKAKATLEKEKEELVKRTREETLKEVTMKQGALPVDSQGTAPETTALQMRINTRKKIDMPDAPKLTPGDLGSMAGAGDAFQAYLRDQANGTKPKVQ